MNGDEDRFARYDAAYVLGALTPGDRWDYEAHLSGCPACAAAVAELAGLPGLLRRVPAGLVTELAPEATAAPRGLPRAPSDPPPGSRHTRRPWARVTAGLAAVVAVVAAVLVAVDQDSPGPTGRPMAMTAVRPTPVEATVRLARVAWGTRVWLRCTYVGADPPGRGPYDRVVYRLVVTAREDGSEQTVAQWGVQPRQDAVLTGSTDLTPDQIGRLRLETADGTVLLEADPT